MIPTASADAEIHLVSEDIFFVSKCGKGVHRNLWGWVQPSDACSRINRADGSDFFKSGDGIASKHARRGDCQMSMRRHEHFPL